MNQGGQSPSYFNLNGEGSGSIVNHKTVIHAVSFTPLKAGAIPTGEVRAVDKTPMDFRKIKRIGDDINSEYEQIKITVICHINYCIHIRNCIILNLK